jgi:hypothetical protein
MINKIKRITLEKIYNTDSTHLYNFVARRLLHKKSKRLGKKNFIDNPIHNVTYELDKHIPPQAWLCELDSKRISITTGKNVERTNEIIFEAVWDGKIDNQTILNAEALFGSAISIGKENITFVPGKVSFESLFAVTDKIKEVTYISNSMAYILHKFEEPRRNYLIEDVLRKDFSSSFIEASSRGVDLYRSKYFEDEEFILKRFMFYNFQIDYRGNTKLDFIPAKLNFRNYSQYSDYLDEKIHSIFSNAKDPARKRILTPVTTLSKGYDSTAVSVLAKQNGCTKGLTVEATVYDYDDSGKEIGASLGLEVDTIKHPLSTKIEDLVIDGAKNTRYIQEVLEFFGTQGVGCDGTFSNFKGKLNLSVLITGIYGDFIWDKNAINVCGLPKNRFTNSSYEFRINEGFINIAPICLGARNPSRIIRISNDKDMLNFTLSTDYDRPIPRRIAEEYGVERESFGKQKSAISPDVTDYQEYFVEGMKFNVARYSTSIE